jgi:DNA-binding transcriptional LysR family regulator
VKIAPLLVALARKRPALDVHLKCEDRLLDMVAERIDVAVRVLSALPAEFVARALTEDRRGLYASPAYLRGARAPKTLDDLSSHALVVYSGAASMPRRGRVAFATDHILAARDAARGGLGICELPDYLAREDVEAGALRAVLAGTLPVTRKFYVVYLPSRYLPPQVRAFVDLLVRDAK